MLIEEVVELKEWSTYDPSKVKSVKYNGVDYDWNATSKTFTNKNTGQTVPKTDILFKRLIDDTVNKVAIPKRAGIGTKIGKALGMTGVGQSVRGGQPGGVAKKTLGMTGSIVGRAMDNVANTVAGGIQNFRKGRKDQQDKNRRDAEAPENNIDAFNFTQQTRLKDVLQIIDKQLNDNTYLVGESITVCDYVLFMLCIWADEIQNPPLSFNNLNRYLKTMARDDAIQQACKIEEISLSAYAI